MQVKSVSVLMGAVTESISLEKTVEEILRLPKETLIKEILIAYPDDRVSSSCLASLNKIMKTGFCQGTQVKVIAQKSPRMGFITDLINIAEGSHCITFSSDGAMPVSLIEKMVETEKRNPDSIVSSSRWLPECNFGDYNRFKLILNRLAQIYLRALYHTKLTDLTNAVQIAPTEIMKTIYWEENSFARGMEMVLKPLRLGIHFIEIPTDYVERSEGKSNNSFFELFTYFIPSIRIRFMSKESILKSSIDQRDLK